MRKILFIFLLLFSFNCLSKEVTLICDATIQYIKNVGKFDAESEAGKPTQFHFEVDFDEEKNTLSHRGLYWTCKGFGDDRKVIKETGEINKKTISFGCKSENVNPIVTAKYFESNYVISRSSGKLSAWTKSIFENGSVFFNIEGTCNLPRNKF
ncbi:hypothetical protein [Candidatus Methylopumilus universalis]|uniref:hypothetical protein n=1 Tax=Candidatus Methylopumilus universalis TaxID=2588536 RepID=UPI003BEEC835